MEPIQHRVEEQNHRGRKGQSEPDGRLVAQTMEKEKQTNPFGRQKVRGVEGLREGGIIRTNHTFRRTGLKGNSTISHLPENS